MNPSVTKQYEEDSSFHSLTNKSRFSDDQQYYDVNEGTLFEKDEKHGSFAKQNATEFHSSIDQSSIIKSQFIKPFECSLCNQKDISCLDPEHITSQQAGQLQMKVNALHMEQALLREHIDSFSQIFQASDYKSQIILSELQQLKAQISQDKINKDSLPTFRKEQNNIEAKNFEVITLKHSQFLRKLVHLRPDITSLKKADEKVCSEANMLTYTVKSGIEHPFVITLQQILSNLNEIEGLNLVFSISPQKNGTKLWKFQQQGIQRSELIFPLEKQNFMETINFSLVYQNKLENSKESVPLSFKVKLPIYFFIQPRLLILHQQQGQISNECNAFQKANATLKKKMKVQQIKITHVKNLQAYTLLKAFFNISVWWSVRDYDQILYIKFLSGQTDQQQVSRYFYKQKNGPVNRLDTCIFQIGYKNLQQQADSIIQIIIQALQQQPISQI